MPILGSIIKNAISIRGRIPARKNVLKQQLKQLNKLLVKNQNTAFGKQYNFIDILLSDNLIEEFKNRIWF